MRAANYRETHRCEPCYTCQENKRIAPDPKNFNFVDAKEIGAYLVARVKYPNCTNYEGIKILIYKCKLLDLVKQVDIDPHFTNKKNYISPVARFEPTDNGWNMALELAELLKRTMEH